jgi:hypothetical protein
LTQNLHSFSVADPRTFEGNPYEVADRGVAQCDGLALILNEQLDLAARMARNAAMTRALEAGDELSAQEWENTAEGRRWRAVQASGKALKGDLRVLRELARFDPKHPPKERL